MPKTAACRLCGRALEPRPGTRRYCEACRAEVAAEIARVLRVRCGGCGREFETSHRAVRYCSDECRKKARLSRNRAAWRSGSSRRRRNSGSRAPGADSGGGAAKSCCVCGGAIEPRRGPGKQRSYCSDACRAEDKRTWHREYMRRYLADPRKRAMWSARLTALRSRRAAKKRGEG